MSVEGAASQVLDTETREIAVPDLTSTQTMLGTPEVLRARTAREFQQLKADPAGIPIAGARVQPHRSLAHPRAGLRARRHDAGAQRPVC